MCNEKKIILSVVVFLLSACIFLSFRAWKMADLTNGDSRWALYFENPTSQDLTFTLENKGVAHKLHWKELLGNANIVLQEGDVLIFAGQKNTITLLSVDTPKGEKITLEVLDQSGEKKEIYKILN